VGLSMCSSPLLKEGKVEFACRTSKHPIIHWLHTNAKEGDVVFIDGGHGEFYYRRPKGDNVVLIGGGIGITPLMSIVRYIDEAEKGVRVRLIHSVTRPQELLFFEELQHMHQRNPGFEAGSAE